MPLCGVEKLLSGDYVQSRLNGLFNSQNANLSRESSQFANVEVGLVIRMRLRLQWASKQPRAYSSLSDHFSLAEEEGLNPQLVRGR